MPLPLIDPELCLRGKTAVVTGANTGIGLITARELARAQAHVILACRTEEKARNAMTQIASDIPHASIAFQSIDLGRLTSVRKAVDALKAQQDGIDILVNNAGLAGSRGQTKDGFELAFGVNHLGHFALTTGLFGAFVDGGRIINVSSGAHYSAKAIDWAALQKPTKHATGLPEYAVSKLANVLFTRALSQRLKSRQIDCYSLHPGIVASDVWRTVPTGIRHVIKWFMIGTEEGARTSLYCATAPTLKGQTGLYWDKCKPKTPSRLARDSALAEELWERSARWVIP